MELLGWLGAGPVVVKLSLERARAKVSGADLHGDVLDAVGDGLAAVVVQVAQDDHGRLIRVVGGFPDPGVDGAGAVAPALDCVQDLDAGRVPAWQPSPHRLPALGLLRRQAARGGGPDGDVAPTPDVLAADPASRWRHLAGLRELPHALGGQA